MSVTCSCLQCGTHIKKKIVTISMGKLLFLMECGKLIYTSIRKNL